MAVVDLEEQQRRERTAGGTFTVIFIAFLLGLPFLGVDWRLFRGDLDGREGMDQVRQSPR